MTTIRTLELTLEWLDNLERVIGAEALIDAMPNDFRGRLDLRAALGELRGKPPPAPWHVDQGHIRDKNGNALASIPYTLGDDQDRANALLMAHAPALAAQVGRLCDCLIEAVTFALATSPGGGHNAGMWATAIREARPLLAEPAPVTHQEPARTCAKCGRPVAAFDTLAEVGEDGRVTCGPCVAGVDAGGWAIYPGGAEGGNGA